MKNVLVLIVLSLVLVGCGDGRSLKCFDHVGKINFKCKADGPAPKIDEVDPETNREFEIVQHALCGEKKVIDVEAQDPVMGDVFSHEKTVKDKIVTKGTKWKQLRRRKDKINKYWRGNPKKHCTREFGGGKNYVKLLVQGPFYRPQIKCLYKAQTYKTVKVYKNGIVEDAVVEVSHQENKTCLLEIVEDGHVIPNVDIELDDIRVINPEDVELID